MSGDLPDVGPLVKPSAGRRRHVEHGAGAHRAVSAAVARARKASGLSQVQLASAASVQQAEVSRIERGHANPTVSTFLRIAQATGSRLELVAMGERSVWAAVPHVVEQAVSATAL